MMRYYWQGKPQKMGLGSITLADARDKAIDANRLLGKAINPRDDRDEKRNAIDSVLFFDLAEALRLEMIFAAANASGKRKAENPAPWKGYLEHLLPKSKRKGKVRGPHPSLPYEELPAFMPKLAAIDTVGARMLETCILTCARTNEIINMKWSDVDLERGDLDN